MSITVKILWAILGLSLIAAFVALATWGIPAPTAEVAVQIPASRFLQKE